MKTASNRTLMTAKMTTMTRVHRIDHVKKWIHGRRWPMKCSRRKYGPVLARSVRNNTTPHWSGRRLCLSSKGSFEALSKPSGYLSKEEYFDLGRKRAPNFSGEREHIYEIFKKYDHFKRQKVLFDELDLVQNVFNRFVLWLCMFLS